MSYRVTIPEGLTSHQIVERLKADANLAGEIEAVPPEGSLLPETFVIERGMPAPGRSSTACRPRPARSSRRPGRSARRTCRSSRRRRPLVLASIVEKETGRSDERERVAAVFINRLRQNMRLQSDPTILYGQTGGKTVWSRPIQKSEIGQKTSHNTYQIDGLPPTPICNPGRAAIEAVLNPADTKELYFVADGAGGHVFSETLKDHNANVQKWRAVGEGHQGQGRGRPPPTRRPPPRPPPRRRRPAPSCAPCRRPRRAGRQGAGGRPAPSAKAEALSAAPALHARGRTLPCPSAWLLRLQSAGASARRVERWLTATGLCARDRRHA